MATGYFYKKFIEELFEGTQNLCGVTPDTVKCALMNTSYVFDEEETDAFTTLDTNEITTAGGYVLGGIELETLSVSYAAGVITLETVTNPTWTGTGAAMDEVFSAIVYNSTTDRPIMYIDFGGTSYLTAEDKLFQINFSSGLATATITIPEEPEA